MGLFDKIFGKKTTSPTTAQPAAAPTPTGDPAKDPNRVKVFDQFGRELYITRQEWLKSVLLPNIEKAWDKPEQLAGLIINGLEDGFTSELLKATERLSTTDRNAERGAVLHAITLLKSGRVDDSERMLQAHISRHGESGAVLTNLAKVYAERKDDQRMMSTLWHGLEIDPNQENAVGWYKVIHREKNGERGGYNALTQVAALPGSWRAQLWLARSALEHRDLEKALSLYGESLARAPRPVPTDFLMQMSGDLGRQGHLPELINLTAPHFSPEVHGMTVGNNLIKGYLDLGQLDQARAILDQLYAQKRPDWKENLSFWDAELSKAGLQTQPALKQEQLQITLLTIEGPVWMKPDSPAVELFPARPVDGPSICFLGGSIEYATNSRKIEQQMADAAGRLSRALPLFFAEQAHWSTDARVSTLIPWVVGPPGGFVVSGVAWEAAQAAYFARQGDRPHDYVVTVHIKTQSEPWLVELHVIRTIDGTSLGSLAASFNMANPETAVPMLARQLIGLLRQEADATSQQMPASYAVPQGSSFPYYLLRLEQLLAVRCGGMDGAHRGFLSGEREIVDGSLQLCLSHPDSLAVRLLFAQTLAAMKRARPDVVGEFQDKAALLQKKHPLPSAAQGVIERIISEALAA